MLSIPHHILFVVLLSIAIADALCPNVISRDDWGARPAISSQYMEVSPMSYVMVHHSGSPKYCTSLEECAALTKEYQDVHMDVNGWPDIGYNFLIGEDGNIFQGRGWDLEGFNITGFSMQSCSVCFMGDFSGRAPNTAALTALDRLIRCGVEMGKLPAGYRVIGHRQVDNATTSPGDALYAYVASLEAWTPTPQPYPFFPFP